ncbi:MAG: hypothetical protein HZC18_03370 [Candidatus Omnitrophica bacterium]|nr:hypothetical protein [Candidatus Omnitrophota bacterium]
MKLHLGCGTKKLEGWINIDSVPECRPDVVHDISKPLPYADQSAEELLGEDLLEHFDKYIRYLVFYEWTRVLKVGGKITLQVPDFKTILLRYFKFGYNNFVDFIFGENLWESRIYIGHFGNHKWGYSQKTLKEFVSVFGIETANIRRAGLNIRLEGIKRRHVTLNDLDNVTIYSHANKFGNGQERVTLKFAREAIKRFQETTEKSGAPR